MSRLMIQSGRKVPAEKKKQKNLCMTEIIMLNEQKELQISE